MLTQHNPYTIWKVCAWGGPVFLFALIVCWAWLGNFFPAPREYWTAEEVKSFYIESNTQIKTGMLGVLFFGGFYLLWTAVMSKVIQEIEGPKGILSSLELLGGVGTTMIVEIFGTLWLTVSFRPELRTPEDILLLHDFGWLMFDCTFSVTFIQMAAFSTAVLLDKRARPLFPRWVGWFGYFAAFVFFPVLLIPFFTTGPFAWHGVVNYYIALGPFFPWMLACIYFMFRAINRLEQDDLALVDQRDAEKGTREVGQPDK